MVFITGQTPPRQAKKPPQSYRPTAFLLGVHSPEPAASIISALPESLALAKRIDEADLIRETMLRLRAGRGAVSTEPVLVYNSISSRHLPEYCFIPSKTTTHFQVYHRDLYLCRHSPESPPTEPTSSARSAIELFSKKSKSNLRHICDNSGHRVRSQFCLTYHENYPTDGKKTKRDLRAFLKAVKRIMPNTGYLWTLEFQERGAPHYHIFFTALPSEEQHERMAASWVCITNGTDLQLKWHLRAQTCKPWVMAGSGYLLKEYVVKTAQKDVPKEYINVGRFWGNSKDMQPVPLVITPEEIAKRTENDVIPWLTATVEHYLTRTLRKWQEHQMNYDRKGKRRRDPDTGKVLPKKKAAFTRAESTLNGNFKIFNGTKIFNRLLHHITLNAPDMWALRAQNRDKVPF